MNIKDFPLMAQILWLLAKESGFTLETIHSSFRCPFRADCPFPLHSPNCPLGMLREARKEGLFGEPRQDMPYAEMIAGLRVGDWVEIQDNERIGYGFVVGSQDGVLRVEMGARHYHFYFSHADSTKIGASLYVDELRIIGRFDAKTLERMTE